MLSEHGAPNKGWEIHEIVREFQQGDFSGEWSIVEVREIDGPECAKLLTAQGSEPGFFGLDDDGNLLDENEAEDDGYYYKLLPAGNRSELPAIDAGLVAREIAADYQEIAGGGRCYRIPAAAWEALPGDDETRFLLVQGDQGHPITPDHQDCPVELIDRDGPWLTVGEPG